MWLFSTQVIISYVMSFWISLFSHSTISYNHFSHFQHINLIATYALRMSLGAFTEILGNKPELWRLDFIKRSTFVGIFQNVEADLWHCRFRWLSSLHLAGSFSNTFWRMNYLCIIALCFVLTTASYHNEGKSQCVLDNQFQNLII